VLAGRYGPYITDGSKNANVPKEQKPEELTLEAATALLAAAPEKKGGKKGGRVASKAAVKGAAKAPAKKARKPASKKKP
jgi:DNA topoisomerase-1